MLIVGYLVDGLILLCNMLLDQVVYLQKPTILIVQVKVLKMTVSRAALKDTIRHAVDRVYSLQCVMILFTHVRKADSDLQQKLMIGRQFQQTKQKYNNNYSIMVRYLQLWMPVCYNSIGMVFLHQNFVLKHNSIMQC